MGDLIISMLRAISSFLDGLVAWVIDEIYKLIMYIADTNVFGADAIEMFSRRIYVLLSIFMLFKISFSLVNYLINPDNFHSDDKGFGKIITNSMIVLILIVITPFAFSELYNVQGMLLRNKTVEQIILGVGQGSDLENNAGPQISFAVFSAFFTPNLDAPGMSACADMYGGELSSQCRSNVAAHGGTDAEQALVEAFGGENGDGTRKASKLLSTPLTLAKDEGEFLFNYKFLISTLTGGAVAYLLLITSIDIAVRSVKLGFLQLIAPIPIISYIDPDSSKKGVFKNWLTQTLKTYLDLFIRLAAIFFAVFIISLIVNNKMEFISSGEVVRMRDHPFVTIFILIGALMFANQVPKLISDLIPGANLDGAFTLNPMKKVGASPIAAGAIGGLVGTGVGAAGSFAAHRALGHNVGRSLLGGVGGAFSGGARGLTSGGDGSPIQSGIKAGGMNAQNIISRDGTTVASRMSAQAASALGLSTRAEIQDNIVKQYDQVSKLKSDVDNQAEKQIMKQPDRRVQFSWTNTQGQTIRSTGNLQVLKNQIDSLKSSGAPAAQIADATTAYHSALNQAKKDYVNEKMDRSNPNRDDVIDQITHEMNKIISSNDHDAFKGINLSVQTPDLSAGETFYGNIDTITKTSEKRKVTLQSSDEWKIAHASKDLKGGKK